MSKAIDELILNDPCGELLKAADILEGGKAAFDLRKRKYGF